MNINKNMNKINNKINNKKINKKKNKECPICMTECESHVKLKCDHYICLECFIKSIVHYHVKCPLCRLKIKELTPILEKVFSLSDENYSLLKENTLYKNKNLLLISENNAYKNINSSLTELINSYTNYTNNLEENISESSEELNNNISN